MAPFSVMVALLLAFLMGILPSPSGAAVPRLALSVDAAEVGTPVVAKGAGFKRNASGRIVVDGQTVKRFRTNRRGKLSVSFSLPDVPAGTATVLAKARGSAATDEIIVGATTEPARKSPTPTPAPTAPAPTPAPTASPAPTQEPATTDPYVRRVRAELKVFTDWLSANGVTGYMGEIGWPSNLTADQKRYNDLATRYAQDMRAAGLRGAVWATGEWWGATYKLAPYVRGTGSTSIDTPRAQAPVVEMNADVVGVHVNGGEFGAPSGSTATSAFSNVNRGTYNTAWHYDSQASFNYLASKGVKEVVIPFRWERIQPTLGGSIDTAELARLKDAIARAGNAGMQAVPMVANYGAYWLHDPATGKGIRRAIGTTQVPVTRFADLWTKLSTALKSTPNISSYGLMREPAVLPGATTRAQAQVWEAASQAAVAAIRANGDTEHLLVPGYQYSNTHSWPKQHPARWIVDTAGNHSYEAHHYWASTYDASYKTYDEEVALSRAKGY